MKLAGIRHNKLFHKLLGLGQLNVTYWKNSDEMHQILHRFPRYIHLLLLELLDQPKSREDIVNAIEQLNVRMSPHHERDFTDIDLEKDLTAAIELRILEKQNGIYRLAPGGRELVEHMQTSIPRFFQFFFSAQTVSIVTIIIHTLLSVIKLLLGIISQSAGLIADGIDNTVDTLSSGLVLVGIKYQKERLVSLFMVVMMFVSVGGVAITAVNKIINPEPVHEGLVAVVCSLGFGLLMLLLSAYQYVVGKRQSNFAILCQSVDSRNHVFTSLLVCSGIILSFWAEHLQTGWAHWLYYADAAASVIIGILILQSAIELSLELMKPEEESTGQISHFMGKAQDKVRRRIVFKWLVKQLKESSMSREHLEDQFIRQFCEYTPKILTLSGIGYHPVSSEDLFRYIEHFIQEKKLRFNGHSYTLQ